MVDNPPPRTPASARIAALADDALAEAVDRLRQADGPTDASADSGSGARDEALARLGVLARLQGALEEQIRQTAAAAAAAGANYSQLGAAWNISRQGARQRWPNLVFSRSPADPDAVLPDSAVPDFDPAEGSPLVNATTQPVPYSVLLVEDDDADAMLIEEAMVDRGMARSVQRVADGIAALDYLRTGGNQRPDLIVLDLNMPRMNGRELLAILKNDRALSAVPVVVLTTSASPDDVTGAYQGHANAYVTKPVNLDDFIRSVQSIDAFFLDTATRPVADS